MPDGQDNLGTIGLSGYQSAQGPQELATEAASCVESGAATFHLHVRDAVGGHTLDADVYKAAISAISKNTKLAIPINHQIHT